MKLLQEQDVSEEMLSSRGEYGTHHDPPDDHQIESTLTGEALIGVEPERVDPRTLQIVEQLFPGHHGLQFLAAILRLALAKQLALPELGFSEETSIAVITIQSIRALAKLIGYSYDTTEKYIVVLCQLRLLYKKRHRHQIVLHFPLGRCQLAEPEALDSLNDYRPKVVSFARQVKRRFVLLRKSGKMELSESSTPTVQADIQRLPRLLVEDISRILQQEVDSDVAGRLLMKIEGAVRYPCTKSLHSDERDDSEDANREDEDALQMKESSLVTRPVDSNTEVVHQQSRLLPKTGDSVVPSLLKERRSQKQNAESKEHPAPQEPTVSGKKDDSDSRLATQNSRLSPQNSEKSTVLGEQGAKVAQIPDENASNVNVITLINNITLNVKLVSVFCCRAVEEAPSKWPVYRKVFQSPEVENDTQAIAAALLFVLAHRHDGSIHNLPAVFLQRCKDFHQPQPPKPKEFTEAMALVDHYGQLTYKKLLQELAARHSQVAQVQAWQPEQPTLSVAPTSARLQPIPSGIIQDLEVHVSLNPGGGMTGDIAQRLRGEISHDIRFGRCRVALVLLQDGSSGVLVDKTERKVYQKVLYSEQEWQWHSTKITNCYELFDRDASQRLSPQESIKE